MSAIANAANALVHFKDILDIVRDLSAWATDSTGLDTPAGIQQKIESFLAIARRASALTPSTADEHAIDILAKFADSPEAAAAIVAFENYVKSLDAPAA